VRSTKTFVLIGHESSGKSAVFRSLTGEAVGDESNFRGSTVRVRTGRLPGDGAVLVDTPGIRLKDDNLATQMALGSVSTADTVVLVVRGTHVRNELEDLLAGLWQKLAARHVAVILTFGDLAAPELRGVVGDYERTLGVPIAVVNARRMSPGDRGNALATIERATLLKPESQRSILLEPVPVVVPRATVFEHPVLGPGASLLATLALFAIPVWLAFVLANWLEPLLDAIVIGPLTAVVSPLERTAPIAHAVLAGGYGLLTLGVYSFLWAFPVVLFIGISVASTEEIGLKDRITTALDRWMRRIGLSGRDLIPVLSGFGCNVVAVFQTRTCSLCTRRACVSLIAFGSACSYQIGASLSIFNSAGHPGLFLPYILFLFVVGALHTRLWSRERQPSFSLASEGRAFLQRPTLSGGAWRVRAVLKQFLGTAMPVFLGFCVVSSVLQHFGVLDRLAGAAAPLFDVLNLPSSVAPGVVFSIIRKDGLLVLNQDHGALLQQLSAGQTFILVYLASTLTACLVTVLAIARELSVRWALQLMWQQVVTAVLSTALLAIVVRALE
jgi:ferrous iron transport protein B